MDTQRDGRRDGRRVRRVKPFRGRQRQMKCSVSEDGWKNTQTDRKTDTDRQIGTVKKKTDRQRSVERDAAIDRQPDRQMIRSQLEAGSQEIHTKKAALDEKSMFV